MTFKDELYRVAKHHRNTELIIKEIKDKALEAAKKGLFGLHRIYRLKTENKRAQYQPSHFLTAILDSKDLLEEDNCIIEELINLGFKVTFISVNLNPHPEVGEEGYEAAYFINVYWGE